MTRGNDKNNHLKGIPFQNFFSGGGSSFKFRLSNLFHFKKKASWEHVNFHSACYTKRLPSQALDVTPGLISSASGLNQVHAWLLKELVLIPRSGTRLTFSSRLLIASLTTHTRLRRQGQVRHGLSAVGESHHQAQPGFLPSVLTVRDHLYSSSMHSAQHQACWDRSCLTIIIGTGGFPG